MTCVSGSQTWLRISIIWENSKWIQIWGPIPGDAESVDLVWPELPYPRFHVIWWLPGFGSHCPNHLHSHCYTDMVPNCGCQRSVKYWNAAYELMEVCQFNILPLTLHSSISICQVILHPSHQLYNTCICLFFSRYFGNQWKNKDGESILFFLGQCFSEGNNGENNILFGEEML